MNHTIKLKNVIEPTIFPNVPPISLNEETIHERKNKVLKRMKEESIETLLIYADKEHGGNFEYLTGFIPRFEEGLLVIDNSEKFTLILGNENLKMQKFARIECDLIHYPQFSLPNQPMDNEIALEDIFSKLNLNKKNKVAVAGWKMFTTKTTDPTTMFDVPYFIIDALKNILSSETELINGAYLLIGEKGSRTTNNANEIAHYEYGANLSSNAILEAMNAIEIGKKETEIGSILNRDGQYNTVVTISATGKRFENANIYPSSKEIQYGDPISMTVGYKGGLSSRTGFVIKEENDLPTEQSDYLDRVAKPYFNAVVTWIENIKIGKTGKEIYDLIESVLPQSEYGWHLNPGHLTSDEEWMSSPIYKDSEETIQSGMILQIDIIPSVSGYTGVSAEECIAIADRKLREQIKRDYPNLWDRIQTRKEYLINVLNINLTEEILPLSNTVAYLRPFLLSKNTAFCNK
ncbi:M24 family metallopeptidase [Enterococcus casseliflavus]|uniref:M24 family metallopeptidase n=1 Tax=Enterococcus casseliflavus TaxID=37734 RepID=UPI0035D6F7A5